MNEYSTPDLYKALYEEYFCPCQNQQQDLPHYQDLLLPQPLLLLLLCENPRKLGNQIVRSRTGDLIFVARDTGLLAASSSSWLSCSKMYFHSWMSFSSTSYLVNISCLTYQHFPAQSIFFLFSAINLRDLVDSHPLTDAVNLAAGRGSICLNLGFLTSFLVPEYFLADQFLTRLMGNVADVDMMDRSKLRT